MKKIIISILIIGMTLLMLNVATATTYTQEQLESFSNIQISNYLTSNLRRTSISHTFELNYKFYFRTKTIKKMYDNHYKVYDKFLTLNLPKTDWDSCMTITNNNKVTCIKVLITNMGTYGDATYDNEDGTTEIIAGRKTINQQLRDRLVSEYRKVIYYRDNSEQLTDITNEGVTI